MAEFKLSSHRHTTRNRAAFTPKLDQYRKRQAIAHDENKELADATFAEFLDKMQCDELDVLRKEKRGGFYIALKYVCAHYMSQKGCNNTQIARLLKKDRATIIHGIREVTEIVSSHNYVNRFYYKLMLDKIR